MAFDPQRDFEIVSLITTLQQTNYATVRVDGDLTTRVFFNAVSLAQQAHRKHSDAAMYGKQHPYPTAIRTLTKDLQLGRAYDASSLMVGQAAAFTLGAVATAGTPPNLTHTITRADLLTSKDAPVTTMYEEEATGLKRKLHAVAFNDFTLSGNATDPVQLQFNVIGSGETTDGAIAGGLPAVTAVTFFDGGSTLIKLGPQGAPVDISERVVDWSFTVDAQLKAEMGRHPGGGAFLKRIWYGNWKFKLDLRVLFDATSDMFDLYTANTKQECQIVNQFDAQHEVTTKFPALIFTGYEPSSEGGVRVHNLSTGDDGVMLDAGGTPNEPIEITVKNNITTYLATS